MKKDRRVAINQYTTSFGINDKVNVIALNIEGRVMGIYIGFNYVEYKVHYFYNGEVKNTYLVDSDLKLVHSSNEIKENSTNGKTNNNR